MKFGWPTTPIGSAAEPIERPEVPLVGKSYRQVGVRLWGEGAYERETIDGGGTQYAYLNQLAAGDIIVNKIWARNGSVSVVQPELEGCYCSTEFPLFRPNPEQLEPRWFFWMTKTKWFWDQCDAKSRGTSGKNRIRPEQFLQIEIPLPPLAEQRRIVAKIERVAGKVDSVYETRADVAKLTDRFLLQVLRQMILDAPIARLSDIAPVLRRPVEIEETAVYPEVGIRSFGKGTFHKPALAALDVGAKRLFQIQAGDLLFSNVFAWEGAIAVAQLQDHGRFGSHRFITCVPKSALATAEYLCSYFLTPEGLRQIGEASPGGAGRNRTLGVAKLEEIPVPVPAYEEQVKFTRLLAKVNATRFQQTQTVAALDALLPAVLDRAFRGEL